MIMNYRTIKTLENNSRLPPAVTRATRPVHRKPAKDPMKLFPYLFQFCSPRFSEADNLISKTRPASRNDGDKRRPLFLAFRSPSDQLCVVAIPSCQLEADLDADQPNSAY